MIRDPMNWTNPISEECLLMMMLGNKRVEMKEYDVLVKDWQEQSLSWPIHDCWQRVWVRKHEELIILKCKRFVYSDLRWNCRAKKGSRSYLSISVESLVFSSSSLTVSVLFRWVVNRRWDFSIDRPASSTLFLIKTKKKRSIDRRWTMIFTWQDRWKLYVSVVGVDFVVLLDRRVNEKIHDRNQALEDSND